MTSNDTANDTDVYYDPYDIGIIADPYPVYARLREEAPIYYNEKVQLLGDIKTFRRRTGTGKLAGLLQPAK